MRIMVPVKRVVDPNAKVRLKPDGSGVDLTGARMSMNPFDEIAVEQAVRLREANIASEVLVVSLGPAANAETLRAALALGADRAVLVRTDHMLEPLAVAKALAVLAEQERTDLVLMGKQAIDSDMNATGQMLAARLGWPQATFASAIEVEAGSLRVTREVDGGLQTLGLPLPAVVTVDLRLNEPRYASLPNIMKAKKKPLAEKGWDELGVDATPRLDILAVAEPATRAAGRRVATVEDLAAELKRLVGERT